MIRPGPRSPSLSQFLLPALLVPLALAASLFWIQAEYERWEDLRAHARESYQRRSDMIDLLSMMRSAETNQRGYAISGDDEFRGRYVETERQAREQLRRIAPTFGEDAVQRTRLADLGRTMDSKFVEMDEVFLLHDRDGPEAARARISDGEGKQLMERFERTAAAIIMQEVQTGDRRVAASSARSRSIQRMMRALLGFGSLLLALLLIALWRQRQTQYQVALRGYGAAERNQAILNGTADPILIINPSGTIETINAAATRLLGYQPEDLARRDISVVADIAPGTGSFHDRIGLSGGVLKTPFLNAHPVRGNTGAIIPFDIALGVMSLPDGDHVVASLRDITERRRLDRLKDDLISTVSHELRTPLTSVVGALALLRADAAGVLAGQARELVGIAENNAQRLIRLINDMLDVDRIESGKLRLTMRPIDIRDVVMRGCDDNQGLARSFNATLICHVPDEPLIVEGDDDRILQVIVNLVSNALKFSPAGGKVRVSVRRSPDSRRAIVQVDDDGTGIPDEFRSRIFGRFERASDNQASTGTGLGLAIAQEIVTQHGGKIWFEDRPAGGTRFAFSLPVAAPATIAPGIDSEPKILICERDAAIGRALQALLSQEGYRCRVVETAASARRAIADDGYSMLLLDMALDDANAFALARDVRELSGPNTLSILMVTPRDGDADPAQISLDLIDWIEKPIDPPRLRTAIAAALRRSAVETPIVLHLDDDPDTLDITAAALAQDARILKATSLEEARRLLAVETPHLAIIDYHLAQGSGLDLLPGLVDQDGIAIPTILYSAQDISIAPKGQIDAVIVKSRTSIPDLKATIRRVMSRRHTKEDRS